MKTCPIPRLLNQRTGDSHYHWTKKWGAGHRESLKGVDGLGGVWQRFCPKWAIRPRTPSPSRTPDKRVRPFAIGRRVRTRFVFREALVRHRTTPESAEKSGVVTDAGDHCTTSRSSSSSRSYVEGELRVTDVALGLTTNGPVCLESLRYPIYGHVNPYGIFRLDMNARLPIDPTEALAA
jgi:hypothetical protein